MTDLTDLTLSEVSALIEARAVSPVEVTRACLARAEATQPTLNAFVRLCPDAGLEAARIAEAEIGAGRWRGPLHGVPVAVKDMIDMAGLPTTGSSRRYAGNIAVEDSAVVARLRAAGAVIVGKTHTHEVAYGVTTPQCANPWAPGHTTGGSSGGSGASVAVGSSFMALGTDTGGSIRIPAACCGVTGLKPTFGLCSRFGIMPLSWTLDHVGPLTRTARDAALSLQALAGFDPRDRGSRDIAIPAFTDGLEDGLAGLRIGIATGTIFDRIEAEVAASFASVTQRLADVGALVEAVPIPRSEDYGTAGDRICLPEASVFHGADSGLELFGEDVARLLHSGTLIPATRHIEARALRRHLRRDWDRIFDRFDAVVMPTIPTPAVRRDQETLILAGVEESVAAAYVRLCVPANITGLPALSVPCGRSAEGLPLAFQILARPFADATVLRIGHAWQRMTDWHDHRPR